MNIYFILPKNYPIRNPLVKLKKAATKEVNLNLIKGIKTNPKRKTLRRKSEYVLMNAIKMY